MDKESFRKKVLEKIDDYSDGTTNLLLKNYADLVDYDEQLVSPILHGDPNFFSRIEDRGLYALVVDKTMIMLLKDIREELRQMRESKDDKEAFLRSLPNKNDIDVYIENKKSLTEITIQNADKLSNDVNKLSEETEKLDKKIRDDLTFLEKDEFRKFSNL